MADKKAAPVVKSTNPIRIGFVGAGGNTRLKHLPGLSAIAGVELVAVANRSLASAEKVAREFGITRAVADWREVVSAPDVDAVCIGTWPDTHAEVTIAALRAGKHVLCEARMARDAVEAEAMLAESKRHPQLVAQLVPSPYTLRFDAKVKELIAGGALGVLREVQATFTGGQFARADAPMSWRLDHAISGMNTLSLGIFYEVFLRWLDHDPEWVAADAAIFTSQRRDETGALREVGTPESLTVLGRYGSSTRLVMHFSGVQAAKPRGEFRLNGSKACLWLDVLGKELWLAENGCPAEKVEVPALPDDGWNVEADFIASIRMGAPVRLTDFSTGVRYMRFTEAVWKSWSGGCVRVGL
jgi:predicted dehydrogenase